MAILGHNTDTYRRYNETGIYGFVGGFTENYEATFEERRVFVFKCDVRVFAFEDCVLAGNDVGGNRRARKMEKTGRRYC
jgi:hypothetical protein